MASSHVANISAYNTGCNIKRAAIRRASYRRERTRKGRARTAAHLQCIALAMGVLQRLCELEVPFHARLKHTHARTHTRSAQHPLASKQAHNNLCKKKRLRLVLVDRYGWGLFVLSPSVCSPAVVVSIAVCLFVCLLAGLFASHRSSSCTAHRLFYCGRSARCFCLGSRCVFLLRRDHSEIAARD